VAFRPDRESLPRKSGRRFSSETPRDRPEIFGELMQRKIEATILISLAILVIAGLLALAARGRQHVSLGPGPAPP